MYDSSMKKVSILVVAAGVLLFQSCKEIGPKIDFGTGVQAGDDTAYTSTAETALPKKVLAEEFTGVSCPPCPKGHKVMRSINTQLNDRMVIIAYHKFDYPQTEPLQEPHKSHYDFRTEDASEAANNIFGGLPGMPYAGFDRVAVGGASLINTLGWSNAATTRAAEASPVNIHITSVYDATTKEATIKVKLAYTQTVNLTQNLTLAITEDSIVDRQKDQDDAGMPIVLDEYDHEHVLRDVVTPVAGTQIPDKVNPKVAGRVYERTFKVKLKDEWKPEHCNVIAFVTNNEASDRRVVQVEEVKLSQ